MIDRKEIRAKIKKKVHFENSDQIIFSIKRRSGEQPPENIHLTNEEEMLQFINSRKRSKFNMDEIIKQTSSLSLDQQEEKIVVLERVQIQNPYNEEKETVKKNLIQAKREQFTDQLRKQAREKVFAENRKNMIIQLEQKQDVLTCSNEKQEYEQEEDFYVMKQISRKEADKEATKLQMDAKQIEKYFDNHYVESDHEKKMSDEDSEDSQRTDQDAYDYPEDCSKSSKEEDQNEDGDDDSYSSEESCKKYQRKDIQEKDDEIEIDDEQPPPLNQSAAFMQFIRQHESLEKQKKDWRTFNYEKDF